MKTCLLITVYNRSQLLEKSLERLTHLTLPDEVLVVDDGSTDASEWVCKGFKERLPIRYLYNHNPKHSICSFARNIGVKNTDADVIITSEPELLFITDIIAQMKAKHKEYPDHVISVGTVYHGQEQSRLSDIIYTSPREFLQRQVVEDYEIQPRPYDQTGFVKTVNMQATFCALYKKEWILQVGGWDEQFPGNYGWDDIDLCTRLRIMGYNQVIDKDMEAMHQYHPHQPPHIQGPQADLNDKYFKGKKLENKDSGDIIANRNIEWGVILKRP